MYLYVVKNLSYLYIALVFWACSAASEGPQPKVFHYNQHNNITSLDPAYAKSQNNIWAVSHLYNTLVQLNDSLEVVPSIAKKAKISEDGLSYTFILENEVKYHESECFDKGTRSVKAEDFVYSFNRLIDTSLNAPGSWIFKGRVSDKRPFYAVNDTTLVIRLKAPFAPFLSLLTMQYCSVIPKEAVSFYGDDFYKNPIGTGAFKFKKWLDNQGLFLIANEAYFKQDEIDHNLDGVRTSFIGERSIAFLELSSDHLDFFSGLESSFINTALTPDGTLRPQFRDRMKFIKSPFLNFEYLGMNPNAEGAHPLLKEKAFRQALNMGIDRELMLGSLRNGIGKPANAGVIPRGLPSYDPVQVPGYRFDPKKAKELLRQYDASLLSIPLDIYTSKDYLDLTTYIAKQWEQLGLNTKMNVVESAELRARMRNGEIALFRASWIADYPDGENFLSLFFSQNPAPPNYTRYNNPEFDALYVAALSTTDIEVKNNLYQSMDRIIVEDAPVIFLFYDEAALFADEQIEGLSTNALNLLKVENIVIHNE